MMQLKTTRSFRPSRLERLIGEIGLRTGKKEAARIPLRQLQEPHQKYLEWKAFALSARGIEDAG